MKQYSIRKEHRAGEEYATMIVRDNEDGRDIAEYRLVSGCEKPMKDAMRRALDRHLAQPNATLGNYQW